MEVAGCPQIRHHVPGQPPDEITIEQIHVARFIPDQLLGVPGAPVEGKSGRRREHLVPMAVDHEEIPGRDLLDMDKWLKVAKEGTDHWTDVSPTGFPQTMGLPVHQLALVALGVSIFDNLDFERAAETAKRLKRWEFLFTAAPLRIDKGMGSPINPIGTF